MGVRIVFLLGVCLQVLCAQADMTFKNFQLKHNSVDWRQHGMVTPVKTQGDCGSCWAFSATGSLEGQLAKANGYLTSLSEQQLIDCDTEKNRGCYGGTVQDALEYVAENGLTTEYAYPYKEYRGKCSKSQRNAVKAKGYVNVFYEHALKLAVGNIGPVSVAINADQLQYYKSGIFDPGLCSSNVNHGVLVVGYGSNVTTGKRYWIIKNSWGPAWGENGYYRMTMGRNLCGITRQGCYPTGVTSSGNYLLQNSILVVLGFVMLSFNAFVYL